MENTDVDNGGNGNCDVDFLADLVQVLNGMRDAGVKLFHVDLVEGCKAMFRRDETFVEGVLEVAVEKGLLQKYTLNEKLGYRRLYAKATKSVVIRDAIDNVACFYVLQSTQKSYLVLLLLARSIAKCSWLVQACSTLLLRDWH